MINYFPWQSIVGTVDCFILGGRRPRGRVIFICCYPTESLEKQSPALML